MPLQDSILNQGESKKIYPSTNIRLLLGTTEDLGFLNTNDQSMQETCNLGFLMVMALGVEQWPNEIHITF